MRRGRAFTRILVVLVTGCLVVGAAAVPAAGGAIVRTPGEAAYEFRLRSGQAGKA